MNRFMNRFHELEALHRGLDQVFAETWPGFLGPGSLFLPGRSARDYPLINLAADADAFTVEALAPGLDMKTLEITVQGNVLTIAGQKKPIEGVEPAAFHRNERSTGRFLRSYRLDCEIDESKVKAEYRNGLLKLTLPKSEAAKPRKIAVSVK